MTEDRRFKALFFDVDGTLVSFRTHRVPDSAREALCEAHERGVKLYIATGRAAKDLEVLEGIPCDGVVALNGSHCVAGDGRTVGSVPIPRADFEHALALAGQLGFSLAFELDEGLFVNRLSSAAEEWARLVAHPVPVECDLRELFERCECRQMCFFFDVATERRVMAELPGLMATRWCPLFADINVAGTSKATGLELFARVDGFTPAETMAFGDGGNDAAMLRAAGVGVAMGNGCEEALRAADYVTASVDDDGLRRAFELFGIIGRQGSAESATGL
ncbi:Cof-type HAD-IIB family hydrolase [Alistipes sp. Marseille-P5061]|uniref:Cof-type HAD-IIB family hydrolase n=1 Tax=Alistipes sp. Marseille-P5061 TaxID=2048242 RepID=UPI00320ADD2E